MEMGEEEEKKVRALGIAPAGLVLGSFLLIPLVAVLAGKIPELLMFLIEWLAD